MRGVRQIASGLFRVLAAVAAEELLVCRLRAKTYQHDWRLPDTALCFQAIRARVAGHSHSWRVKKSSDYELCRISEKKPGVLDEFAAEQANLLDKEIATLDDQASRVAEEIKELGGDECLGSLGHDKQ